MSTTDHETAYDQVQRLARFIEEHIDGEPSQSQGAVDTAIRLLSTPAKLDVAASVTS